MSALLPALPALASLALLLAPAAAPTEAAFAAGAPKGGAKQRLVANQETLIDLKVSMGGQVVQSMKMPTSSKFACDVTIETVDASAATAASLAFGACEETVPNPFGGAPTTSATGYANTTVTAKGGAAGYTFADGAGEVGDDARRASAMIANHLLGPPPLARLLAGKSFKKGDRIEVPADLALLCFGTFGDDTEVKSLALTLAEEPGEGDTVVFQAAAKLAALPDPAMPATVTMEPSGTWTVAKSSCRVVAMAMKGPLTMTGSMDQGGMKIEMNGTGDWKLDWSVSAK